MFSLFSVTGPNARGDSSYRVVPPCNVLSMLGTVSDLQSTAACSGKGLGDLVSGHYRLLLRLLASSSSSRVYLALGFDE